MDLTPMFVGLGVLGAVFLIIYLVVAARTWSWGTGSQATTLAALALPAG